MTEAAFLAAVVEAGKSSDAMLVYADWLEGQGREEAEGWRWIHDGGKWPNEDWALIVPGYWWYLFMPARNCLKHPRRHWIPRGISPFLTFYSRKDRVFAEYSCVEASLADLARAVPRWLRLPDGGRA